MKIWKEVLRKMENGDKRRVICERCGKPVSGDAYEFKGAKLCEDCYFDEVIASQPKKCRMK